jgi:thioesterase domain-containing protein
MDSVGPETLPETGDFEDVKVMAYALGLNVNIDLPEDFRQYSLEEQIRYYLKFSEMAVNQTYPEEFISHIRHFLDVIKANNQAMENYVPKNYPGKILFFRASERDEFLPQNPERSWGNLATEGMDIYEISGNHTSINFSPNVEKIVNILNTYLDK